MFEVLRAHNLKLKASKCFFGQTTVVYLEHFISIEGVAFDSDKVQCIVDWPQPRTIKGLRGFLGLVGYYCKFVPHFGLLAHPLTELLKKDNFMWSSVATQAFSAFKRAMSSTPVFILKDIFVISHFEIIKTVIIGDELLDFCLYKSSNLMVNLNYE